MRLRLATKFSATILGVLALSISSSLLALYAAWRIDRRLEEAHKETLPSVRAEEVEIILLERNTLVTSYLLDKGNPVWQTTTASNCSSSSKTGSPRSAARRLFQKKRRPSCAAWRRPGPISTRGSRKPLNFTRKGRRTRRNPCSLPRSMGDCQRRPTISANSSSPLNDRYVRRDRGTSRQADPR